MDAVVMRIRQIEPAAMDGFHPVSGENEKQKPDDEDQIIDRRAIQKKTAQKVDVHDFSSVSASAAASFYCSLWIERGKIYRKERKETHRAQKNFSHAKARRKKAPFEKGVTGVCNVAGGRLPPLRRYRCVLPGRDLSRPVFWILRRRFASRRMTVFFLCALCVSLRSLRSNRVFLFPDGASLIRATLALRLNRVFLFPDGASLIRATLAHAEARSHEGAKKNVPLSRLRERGGGEGNFIHKKGGFQTRPLRLLVDCAASRLIHPTRFDAVASPPIRPASTPATPAPPDPMPGSTWWVTQAAQSLSLRRRW